MKYLLIIAVIAISIFGFKQYQGNQSAVIIDTQDDIDPEISLTSEPVRTGANAMIQIPFEIIHESGVKFRDTLNFTQAEYEKLTPADIQKLQYDRYKKWKVFVDQASHSN